MHSSRQKPNCPRHNIILHYQKHPGKGRKESCDCSKSPNRKITHCNWPAFLPPLPLERKRNMLEYVHGQPCLLDLHNNWLLRSARVNTDHQIHSELLSAHYVHWGWGCLKRTHRLQVNYTEGCTPQQPLFVLCLHTNSQNKSKEECGQCDVCMQRHMLFI